MLQARDLLLKNNKGTWSVLTPDKIKVKRSKQALKITCTKDEYNLFLAWREAKAKVVSTHQTWIDSIGKQTDQLKTY